MKLHLVRDTFTSESTIGQLSVDGVWECFTLERAWNGANTPNVSPIPEGTYPVELKYSHHFGRDVLHVLNVHKRSDIEIHVANVASQLLGCIAVGQEKSKDFIGNSQRALIALIAKFQTPCSITIESINPPVPEPITNG